MVKITTAFLLIVVFVFGCYNPKITTQEVKQNVEYSAIQISEKCLALLAYGLLSDDENDIPFGGVCKDIASDSLVKFLQIQKRVFKHWQKTGEIDTNDREFSWDYKGDIGLLNSLIWTRITMEKGVFGLNAEYATEYYGSDYSFIWRLYMFNSVNDKVKSLILDRATSFSDFTAYIDSAYNVPSWCRNVRRYAQELKKYSKDDSSSEDFLLKYYALRCESEDGIPHQPKEVPVPNANP